MSKRVLVIDDEANLRWVLSEALSDQGYEVAVAANANDGLAAMSRQPADVVILDLKLKGMDGLATLARLRERWPDVVVLILTAYGTVASAVEAMQRGAADYLRKPFDLEEIGFKLQRALERAALQQEIRYLRQSQKQATTAGLIGSHPVWLACREQLERMIDRLPLLVLVGEAGVGKAQLGHYAHATSQRHNGPLIELDGALLTEPILVAALHEAGQGTLLIRHGLNWLNWLLAQSLQPRIILTSLELPEQPVPTLQVPNLNQRRSDIGLFARAWLGTQSLSAAALQQLEQSYWSANLPELRHVLERAAMAANGQTIQPEHLPYDLALATAEPIALPAAGLQLELVERSLLQQALQQANGNKTRASELLGLSRHQLLYRLEKHGLS
ncbi:sigma-54-dependent transcriptional regulator [Herpetosiphon sp. NSE202]|uniref:sigma-54-dependent transcriptional regulator n=1 Tax=Herpetosiphon sp. NSE202 TaxID=3351349 RepID=UPI003639D6FD